MSLGLVQGIHRWPVTSLPKGQWRGKCFHLITSSWLYYKALSFRQWRLSKQIRNKSSGNDSSCVQEMYHECNTKFQQTTSLSLQHSSVTWTEKIRTTSTGNPSIYSLHAMNSYTDLVFMDPFYGVSYRHDFNTSLVSLKLLKNGKSFE